MSLITCQDCGHQISDTAPSCPNCGRPSSRKNKSGISIFRILAVLALGFIILRACVSIDDQEGGDASTTSQNAEPSPPNGDADISDQPQSGPTEPVAPSAPGPAPTPAPQVIMDATPAQLYWLYEKNEVSANQLFKGKQVQVTAPVESIDEDVLNNVVLQFGTGIPYESFSATLDDDQRSKAASLNRGDEVTVRCQKMSRILNAPTADHCKIITSSASAQ